MGCWQDNCMHSNHIQYNHRHVVCEALQPGHCNEQNLVWQKVLILPDKQEHTFRI